MRRCRILRCAILFFCWRCLSLCQSTALLTGSVTDSSGAVVAGAEVKCSNTETDLRLTALTNHEGLFRFPDLPVGLYDLSVSHAGFGSLVRHGIRLYTGQTLDLNLSLSVGSTSQSVDVTSPVPLVETTTSDIRTTVFALFYGGSSYVALETVTSPTFGQITYAQDPRLMQVALKLRF